MSWVWVQLPRYIFIHSFPLSLAKTFPLHHPDCIRVHKGKFRAELTDFPHNKDSEGESFYGVSEMELSQNLEENKSWIRVFVVDFDSSFVTEHII